MIAISRAPVAKLDGYRRRLGWTFKWVSSGGNDFNHDYCVTFTPEEMKSSERNYNFGTIKQPGAEMPGISVFYKDDKGAIFHTYSAYSRGIDMMNNAYQYIDLTPKGRDEDDGIMHWVRRNDEYKD